MVKCGGVGGKGGVKNEVDNEVAKTGGGGK